jgi:hypothetical protein
MLKECSKILRKRITDMQEKTSRRWELLSRRGDLLSHYDDELITA